MTFSRVVAYVFDTYMA